MDNTSYPDMKHEHEHEPLLRGVAKSFYLSYGTNAPFQLGPVRFERIGFADIPVALVHVFCRRDAVAALVPIVRQHVYHELETAGLSSDILEFVPGAQVNETRMFVDCNESSPTKGKTKRGQSCRFTFDIKPECVKMLTWKGRIGSIPTRREQV
jgi:hypothetical protein